MAITEFVRARVDAEIKAEASLVLEAMGLSVSDLVRMVLTRVAHDKALPIELVTPNPTTIAAMRAARAGNVETVSLDDLQGLIDEVDSADRAVLEGSQKRGQRTAPSGALQGIHGPRGDAGKG